MSEIKPPEYISFCSGIEAASQAWHSLGWKPKAFCEIDKFPSRVLAHHYPDIPNLGDFTAVDWSQWSADICVGGTPCQAFSVAGLRQSLSDKRGNLSLEFIRAINTIRPRYVVWENVPGVLSTVDNAFGCFLGALVGSDEAVVPESDTPKSKYWRSVKRWAHRRLINGEWKILRWWKPKRVCRWPNAGVVTGPERSACWRVLDAQYFGLAQRRKRVFVIASSGDGAHPAEILFEWESLRRDSPPRREAGESVAGTVASRASAGGGFGTDFEAAGGLQPVAMCLNAKGGGGGIDAESETFVATTAPTLGKESFSTTNSSSGQMVDFCISSPIAFQSNAGSFVNAMEDLTPTLRIGGDGGNAMAVAFSMDFNKSTNTGSSQGIQVEHTNALRTEKQPAVIKNMAVRRLTPRECERLQGFPDDYTLIPGAADGPRYKALGNSMAVPVMSWIGRRIKEHL